VALCGARLDSAHFSDGTVRVFDEAGVEFTISVLFERFPKLKKLIEKSRCWYRLNRDAY